MLTLLFKHAYFQIVWVGWSPNNQRSTPPFIRKELQIIQFAIVIPDFRGDHLNAYYHASCKQLVGNMPVYLSYFYYQ
jgi:hypothetical protein